MKRISTLLVALFMPVCFTAILANGEPGEKTTYTVAPEESQLTWKAYKVTGEHEGTIDLEEGHMKYENGQLIGGEFVADMSTITVTDLSGEYKQKLENHLKSDDFFHAEKFPTARFVITDVRRHGGENGYKVTGNMTIRDKTEKISFPVEVKEQENKRIATADIKIDRSNYNVRYRSGSFFDNLGDKMIYDNFELSIRLVAMK